MNIGILTLKYETNFGGILQAIALQNTIKSYGHNVQVINLISTYKPSSNYSRLLRFSRLCNICNIYSSISDKFRSVPSKREISNDYLKKMRLFIERNINLTEETTAKSLYNNANDQFDAIIVGSDQVWSVLIHEKLIFFFDWDKPYLGLRISYAACSVQNNVPFLASRKIKQCIKSFDFLSVRDETTFNLVKKSSGLKSLVVVDPVFLYNFSGYIEAPILSESYILVYILGCNIKGGHQIILHEIKKKYGNIKIVAIETPNISVEGEKIADVVFDNATPDVWVNLFRYATFVYTDSFHGCAFSLKFHKQFIGYYSYKYRATRLIDLGKRYGVNLNIVSSAFDAIRKKSIERDINYKVVSDLIDNHIEKSVCFLKKALS